jgi:hypothetical protein
LEVVEVVELHRLEHIRRFLDADRVGILLVVVVEVVEVA